MRFAADVQKKRVARAAGSALTKTARHVRKIANQVIRQRWNLKAGVVNSALDLQRMGVGRLAIAIVASGKPIALREFGARRVKTGVTFAVKRATARKQYTRHGRKGFIVEKFGGHVFVRVTDNPPGPTEAKIKKVFGPAIPHFFVSKPVMQKLNEAAAEVWPKRFAEELNYQLNIRK